MGKLKNVSPHDLMRLSESASDLSAELYEVANRLEKGYCDDVAEPVSLARGFLALTRSAADVATFLLSKAASQEQQREIEALLKARIKP